MGEDLILKTVETKRMSEFGTNIRSRKLVLSADGRMARFHPTALVWVIAFLWIAVGVATPVVLAGQNFFAEEKPPSLEDFIMVVFAMVFLGIGCWLFRTGLSPVVFDRDRRVYTRGWHSGRAPWPGQKPKIEQVPFSDIHGLQILKKRISGSDSDYDCFELNLILKDAGRIHILTDGCIETLRPDSEKLAKFLGGVPVQEV